ncbi:NADH:flavin oxidoreductase 2 [Peniophora sp. CONT]|nr:NADH:flavin oxidoreductase 2 [Peniophora sp. CONT]
MAPSEDYCPFPVVPNANDFYPLNDPAPGALLPTDQFPNNANPPTLFKPITIRGVTFQNRAFLSPMCQYSCRDGHVTDYHLVHLGQFALHGVGAIMVEATAVVPEGRISPTDAGIWSDSHIAPLKRIVDFVHAQGSKIGIQLAHAGRKASTVQLWMNYTVAGNKPIVSRNRATEKEGGWPDKVMGPTDAKWADDFHTPKAMTDEDLQTVEDAFVAAIERCKTIGFDFIELHAAHGYLMSSFLSPLTNTRTDKWGGQSLENRLRFPLRIAAAARKTWEDKPLFVRFSGSEWAEGPEQADGEWKSWGVEQSKLFAVELAKLGVDLLDVSSGGNWAGQQIKAAPGFQVPLAAAVKEAAPNVIVGAVGLILNAKQAEEVLAEGKADVIFLARELLRNPAFMLHAAQEFGVSVKPTVQYERGWMKMVHPKAGFTPV